MVWFALEWIDSLGRKGFRCRNFEIVKSITVSVHDSVHHRARIRKAQAAESNAFPLPVGSG